jgi:hypothetical protein
MHPVCQRSASGYQLTTERLRGHLSRSTRLFNQFYARFVAMSARQLRVAGDQRRIESFCKDYIGRIVCGNRVAQGPNSFQQVLMLCAFDIQGNMVIEGLLATGRSYVFEIHKAPKCLRDLNIDEVRSVEALSGDQHPLLHLDAFVRTKQKLEYG